ncbi:hypothetical protein [Aeromicrobium alkaliterrae]|uniref:hypothetical protein n=1 Tax=Aeromicrobium alkaliterrae TaxID=302168 RepID=UPI0031DE8599
MFSLTEAQSWTVILGGLTAVVSMMSVVAFSFHRVLKAEIGTVRGEIGSLRTEMRTEFRRVDERFDHLDRDVQALTRHVFDRPE